MRHEINRLAEFSDKTLEATYQENEVQKGLRVSKNTILIFSIVNLGLVICDYLYLQYADVSVILYRSLIPRLITLTAAAATVILLNKIENKRAAIQSVIAFAIFLYLLHEYTASHFAPVEPIFEVIDLVLITFALFIIPNRWIVNVCTCVFLVAVFVALTPLTIPTLSEGTIILVTLYLLSHVLFVSVLMYRVGKQKRVNYLQQLQLEALAKTDALTQVLNRAACDRALEQLCRSRCDFSLILMDIDDFKQINDTHGHIAGDEVIIQMTDAIKKAIRKDDILARWGGEEFVIILPHTALDRASEIANRIRDSIYRIRHADPIGLVTASFGVTAFTGDENTKSIINRADQLLYLSKRNGKNNVFSG